MVTPSLANSAAPMAHWQKLYEGAVFELDNRKLVGRIAEARNAIYDRAGKVPTDPSSSERSSLNSALRMLRILEEMAVNEREA